ncbi:GNAT family N-acetyltransferase [Reyranella sp.]|uniref:GNAT family N-acetyltransferase n=1 Tax=Reyranella sp. TaxID=1929291 RepID=UPI003F704FFB
MSDQPTAEQSNRPEITIKLASTSDEMMQCFMLRAAVFMGEQQCPYWEEYDGNDYTASHLILYVDGEPAASIRVRWFAGFAKLERAIILKRYRSYGLFLPFVHWAKEFCRKKGYPKVYLHGQKRLWPIFEKDGFRKVDDKVFHFSDHEYGAFACDLDVGENAPTVTTDPMVLNRPEDKLDMPGILEESMDRGASNPHADWTERRAT